MSTNFDNWEWQLRNSISSPSQLIKYLNANEGNDAYEVCKNYKIAITPYLLKLMDIDDKNCPIRRQFVPEKDELNPFPYSYNTHPDFLNSTSITQQINDPLHEAECSPVPNLIHKYTEKAVILASGRCFAYCRHCERKNTVLKKHTNLFNKKIFVAVLNYLKKHKEISDILISGGDPLLLANNKLELLLSSLREIKHISTIRIGSRAIVAIPMRVTNSLASMLEKYRPIRINTQFNHPKEITNYSIKACEILSKHRILLGNQTVFLKGINDSFDIIKQLMLKLNSIDVVPYYLHQCTHIVGAMHFVTSLYKGINIIKSLRSSISGHAVPLFAVDVPGVGNKIVLEPYNIIEEHEDYIVLKNYKDKPVYYKLIS